MFNNIEKLQEFIKDCDAILITAGAGMGVDSGLPDFRGDQGFWNAYRPFQNKFGFTDCANPTFLKAHPLLFWGFYGHRLQMYRDVKPHQGFEILKRMCQNKEFFIVTSNVDGQFQKAGFDIQKIYEIHGSIHVFQCTICNSLIEAYKFPNLQIDLQKFEASEPLPKCKFNHLLRPNILMFNDGEWISNIYDQQENRYLNFLKNNQNKKVCIIEIGAGTAIPSIRNLGESLLKTINQSLLIRINPAQPEGPQNDRFHSLQLGGLAALKILEGK